MKKIINPRKGLDGYMCFGCAPENPQGLHMEFYEYLDPGTTLDDTGAYQRTGNGKVSFCRL